VLGHHYNPHWVAEVDFVLVQKTDPDPLDNPRRHYNPHWVAEVDFVLVQKTDPDPLDNPRRHYNPHWVAEVDFVLVQKTDPDPLDNPLGRHYNPRCVDVVPQCHHLHSVAVAQDVDNHLHISHFHMIEIVLVFGDLGLVLSQRVQPEVVVV